MSKNNKKAKRNKDRVHSACPKQTPEPINEKMSSVKSECFHEDISAMNKKKENVTTSSEMSHTNSDVQDVLLKVNPDPPESNTQLKHTCRALKSNLNTMTKKYEGEKVEKEKLCNENQDLKSKLSFLEKELQDTKMEIEKLKKQGADPRKSFEEPKVTQMEVETTVDDVSEQPEQHASFETKCEEDEDRRVQANAQGTCEEPVSTVKQDWWDTNESEPISRLAQENGQDKDANWPQLDQKQNDGAAGWDVQAQSSSQPFKYSPVLAPSGSNTRQQNRRTGIGQTHYERHQYSQTYRNEQRHSGPHNFNSGNSNDNNKARERGPNNRGDHDNVRGKEKGTDHGEDRNNYRGRGQDNRGYHGNCRGRGLGNRGGNDNWRERGIDNSGDHGQNHYNHNRYDSRKRTSDEPPVVTEIFGDLFNAAEDYSLAHCVAEDMRMGSGIAVTFRQKFKRVDELLDQDRGQGQVAVLEDKGRYIYYLVTKPESTGKPTLDTLRRSLTAMCHHVVENNVKKIAMPRIGCGLDRLDWRKVKPLIEETFSGKGAQITIYNYNEDVAESPKPNSTEPTKPKPTSNVWLKTAVKPVADIDVQTAILCLCAADRSIDSTFGLLDRKFNIMAEYRQADQTLGNIHEITKKNYLIYLLFVKETKTSKLSFMVLGECVRKACKLIEKQKYYYVAVEAFDDKDDPLIFEKVITVIKAYLDTKWEKELWLCYPQTASRK